jgi:hypothetical protein
MLDADMRPANDLFSIRFRDKKAVVRIVIKMAKPMLGVFLLYGVTQFAGKARYIGQIGVFHSCDHRVHVSFMSCQNSKSNCSE